MNNLCKLPFLHKYVNFIDASDKPCCIFQGEESTVDIQNMFLKNERPEGCSECWRKEDNGILSKREHFNNRFSDYDITSGIKTYDLRLGITCNLKCIMCGPHLSTKWNEDKDVFEKYINKVNVTPSNIEKLEFDDALEIYFAGGEPFYMKEVYECLVKLSKNEFNRKNTKIRINTNALIEEDNKILTLLDNFENIEFTISVEGFRDINDFIRYPSKWKDFLKGVGIIYNMSDKPKSLKAIFDCKRSVAFNVTISCLNLLHIFSLFNWLTVNQYVFVANFVEEPKLLNINSLKPSVICDFMDKYEQFTQKWLYDYELNSINDIIKYVELNYQYDEDMNDKMRKYLLNLDAKRNTSSISLLSECFR